MNDNNNPSEMRKAQEQILSMLQGGYYKEMIKMQKALYDEYVKVGFTKKQAFELVIITTCPK
ncbi:hypothetical protein LCGC14_2579910 [marine sediment metagenome]|uniref:Uncharacterized protein n=1 Tax=marine sediment metagenome TaxID=412755 RepID=A0A0F9AF30_9ZZZZ